MTLFFLNFILPGIIPLWLRISRRERSPGRDGGMKSVTKHATRQVRQITEWLVWKLNIKTHTDCTFRQLLRPSICEKSQSRGRWRRTSMSGKAFRSPVYLCACINSERCSFTVHSWVATLNLTPTLWLLAQTPTVCRFHADTRGRSNTKPLTAHLPRRPHLKGTPPHPVIPLNRRLYHRLHWLTVNFLSLPAAAHSYMTVWDCSGWLDLALKGAPQLKRAEWVGRRMCYTRSVNDMEY